MSDLLPDGSFDTTGDPLCPNPAVLVASWARRVRANSQQVDRFGEERNEDHYAPVAHRFAMDPHRTDDLALNALREVTQPDDTWLDIGAGGGRYALPLALAVRDVIGLDPSPAMLDVLLRGMAEHGVANVRVVEGRWPGAADPSLVADVAFIAHVGYDVEEIGAFLDAMDRSARRLCVSMLFWRRPTWAVDRLWPAVHGVERARLPAMRELVTLLMARARPPAVRFVAVAPMSFERVEEVLEAARHQTWVRRGSEKDRRLEAAVRERLIERDGRLAFDWAPTPLAIVTWKPMTDPVPDA